jgi:hypothetical protein|eukprot:COSAG01_NODE_3470_length_6049_cov_689.357815_4_plen_162_part_00
MTAVPALLRLIMLPALAAGHSSMIMPPARNSIDAELPEYSGGKHPPTGAIDAKKAPCTNGTSVCDSGQSTFWFSQGVRAIMPTVPRAAPLLTGATAHCARRTRNSVRLAVPPAMASARAWQTTTTAPAIPLSRHFYPATAQPTATLPQEAFTTCSNTTRGW